IEYNGKQHYQFVKRFHIGYDNFLAQQERDKKKQILCNQHSIKLISLRYDVKETDIIKILKENNIMINQSLL
ncbi:MAG: hypothetical protein AABY22_29875, partial [Nanoarchaeota archaeon]